MYVDKTTVNERMTISRTTITIQDAVDRAQILLGGLCEKHFSGINPLEKIGEAEIDEISATVRTVWFMLHDACTEFELITGEDDGKASNFLEGAKQYQLIADVEATINAIREIERQQQAIEKASIDFRKSVADKPDDEALPLLKAHLEKLKSTTLPTT